MGLVLDVMYEGSKEFNRCSKQMGAVASSCIEGGHRQLESQPSVTNQYACLLNSMFLGIALLSIPTPSYECSFSDIKPGPHEVAKFRLDIVIVFTFFDAITINM